MGLIPDLAMLRDRAKTRVRKFLYGLFALGWTGSNRHWSNYEKAYLILAGLCDAAGVLGAVPSSAGLLRVAAARLAHDDLPALLRGRRDLLRLRHGADAADSVAQMVPAGGHHHHAAHRRDVQGDAGDRLHRRLHLRHGVFHRLVQRQTRTSAGRSATGCSAITTGMAAGS